MQILFLKGNKSIGMENSIDLSIYRNQAVKYLPDIIKVLFIAESPPAPDKYGRKSYIYFDTAKQEILLTTLTTAVLGDGNGFTKDCDKSIFLKRLKAEGYFLIDAVEYPINMIKGGNNKETIIRNEANNLLERLNGLKGRNKVDLETKIILIKASVYNALSELLKENNYNVLNEGKIDFPKYYNDRDVIYEIRRLINLYFG